MANEKNIPEHPADVPSDFKSSPEDWVSAHGNDLFRFAVMRLRDVSAAEDAVQETFLAALMAREQFRGQSTEKNWLLGILKNKIADHFRRLAREPESASTVEPHDGEEESLPLMGSSKCGRTRRAGPRAWAAPERSLDRQEFWDTLHSCSAKLPGHIGRVYAMREIDEVSTEEICARLEISPANLWVMLHRARAGLRRCLEIHWFGRPEK